MKNLLKKFHIMSNQEEAQKSPSSRGNKSHDTPVTDRFLPFRSNQNTEHKSFSGISNWLTSVANRKSPSSSIETKVEKTEASDLVPEVEMHDSLSGNSRDPELEEEFQIQMALELSAKEDPEAVQIEAVKQISLGSCDAGNTPAEVIAYRYWNYNVLNYDDKILDGFYDLYGVTESAPERMPSLNDLQETAVSEIVTWEAILVNRSADANLLKLEQKAFEITIKSRSDSLVSLSGNLVQKLAVLVSDYMGGPVVNPENTLRAWKSLSFGLKSTLGSMVLPLGSLTIGLARHRALLFKVLADRVSIPCRMVKGHQFTGSDDVAMNFVKVDDGREYIVDLMSAPGTLIPSDAAGSHVEYEELFFSTSSLSRGIDSSRVASSSSGVESSSEEHSDHGTSDKKFRLGSSAVETLTKADNGMDASKTSTYLKNASNAEKIFVQNFPKRPSYPYMHLRSPSWTEGVSSPAVLKKKAKDVSQYMIDAAKENPQLAQKLHDVLIESGVVAPPNLFTEIYPEKLDASASVAYSLKRGSGMQDSSNQDDFSTVQFLPPLPPLPPQRLRTKTSSPHNKGEQHKPVERTGINSLLYPSQSENYTKKVPVAAAAAAAAAVVASSMVVAVSKASMDTNIPVAAAATATAAAVVATTAAVNKQLELGKRSNDDADGNDASHGSGDRQHDASVVKLQEERISDKSVGNESAKSDITLDDVAECEILWEDITLGERIGLGSYGEVYRGDWRGTEVAVKRFLDQDLCGQALEEFRSEVHIMKRVRHPNVVLFMGAITRAPNLSIVTEFLPRGSLYRLLHRPNNQLDERRRLRMALDTARGMNYLHNCTPLIVHRDLKSPNILVDKNWVVKVCDFGLSRIKQSTFLSSRSTAGTAEWMAPEVLRNELSDEKCDVYSFGVILWELCTMQQPWGGMNPMQVVGAVGFQHRRLDIPTDMDPAVASIIRQCWQTDPKLRPTFAEIMSALKPLQKPITSSYIHRNTQSHSVNHKQRSSQVAEELEG